MALVCGSSQLYLGGGCHNLTPLRALVSTVARDLYLFNRRKISFQCCEGLGHASASISRRHAHEPPPASSPPHPSSCLRAQALGCLCHISNAHQLSILHTVNAGVHSKALLSNLPTLSLFLPQCPKVFFMQREFFKNGNQITPLTHALLELALL